MGVSGSKNWMFALMMSSVMMFTACGDATLQVEGDADESTEVFLSLEGINNSFDQNNIMSDDVFEGRLYNLNAQQIQAFLEDTPHNRRSWLADYQVNGKTAAQAFADAGREHDVNPLILLVRVQAEMGHISSTSRPSSDRRVDYAFGCGCPDNQACDPQYRGFDKQLECAAKFLRVNYERSVNAEGNYYSRGRTKRTLDGASVTPRNHATAAHYNYTPHRSAASLSWQLLKSYAAHAGELDPSLTQNTPWVGDTCTTTDQCSGDGTCLDTATGGMCTITCNGLCPDRPGRGVTFCVSLDGGQTGSCVQRAAASNNFCGALAGTTRRTMDRFVGTSNAGATSREVCAPEPAPASPVEPAQPVEPMEPMEPTQPVEPMQPVEPSQPSGDEATPDAFVGTTCSADTQCNFAEGDEVGECLSGQPAGMCSLECAGFCPDKDGFAPTFCVAIGLDGRGTCAPRPARENNFCQDISGTMRVELPRHVGGSSAPNISREVCVPYLPPLG